MFGNKSKTLTILIFYILAIALPITFSFVTSKVNFDYRGAGQTVQNPLCEQSNDCRQQVPTEICFQGMCLRGDINNDGAIDISDFSQFKKDFLFYKNFNWDERLSQSDLNIDNKISMADYSIFVKSYRLFKGLDPITLEQYRLDYRAAQGGSIRGNTNQIVAIGQDGSQVTAIPNAGYSFVTWSDNIKTPDRIDKNVTRDIDVIASFSQIVQEKNSFSAITFNVRFKNKIDGINNWVFREPIVREYMNNKRPDILGTQEVLPGQLSDLQNILKGYSSHVGKAAATGREYCPIFFKLDKFILQDQGQFWLSKTPDSPGSIGWDAKYPRIVTWAKLKDTRAENFLFVFNTHFDHVGNLAREESVKLTSQKIKDIAKDSPVILMGDFNIIQGTETYNYMVNFFETNNSLKNAEYISQTPVVKAYETFNAFSHTSTQRVIDFLFVSNHFEVTSYRVDKIIKNNVFISDHWPVVIEVKY